MTIYNNLFEVIGNTPIVKLSNYAKQHKLEGNILLKLEFMNPLSSVKDRIGLAMIQDAMKDSDKSLTFVEPTSGNTGISLAFVAASMGHKITLVMPESMSIERRKMMKILGANLVLTPAKNGMKGAIEEATKIASETGAIMLSQFQNPSNPKVHENTTAKEILNDTNGEVDIFVAGVGTGGTISGTGKILKETNSNIEIVAVEPSASPVISGGSPSPHKIQGIGAGFIPKNLNTDILDEVVTVSDEDALRTAREIAKSDGIPVGISSGATIYAAIEIAKRPENAGKNIVVIVASCAERYQTTLLFENID